MRVMYTLHEHALTRQLANIWMMVPKRVMVTSSAVIVPKFFERRQVTMLFREINYPASNYAVDVTKNSIGFLIVVGDEMKMIRHDHVRKDQKASGVSCLVEGLAGNDLDIVSSEDWQAVLRNGREVIGRRAGCDLEHCEDRGLASEIFNLLTGKA